MTDALINDKPQFVRLFAENGLNILDYLTYGRLETLYRSVAVGTMVSQLLQRCLVVRLGTAASVVTPSNVQDSASKVAAGNMRSGPMTEISLFEVGFPDERHPCLWSKKRKENLNSQTHFCLFLTLPTFFLRLQGSWNC